jgi:hypothetical protein
MKREGRGERNATPRAVEREREEGTTINRRLCPNILQEENVTHPKKEGRGVEGEKTNNGSVRVRS